MPSTGSTAISINGPFPVPSFSPIYNIGASSSSPSPITTSPLISNLLRFFLISSVAALSVNSLFFFPTCGNEDIAALEVILTRLFNNSLSKVINYLFSNFYIFF